MTNCKNCQYCSKKNIGIIVLITVFILGGTGSTIFGKTGYQLKAEGRDGEIHYFVKPLFFNWAMFLGMSMCLIVYFIQYHIFPCFKKKYVFSEIENSENEKKTVSWKGYLLMLIPAFCDFGATYLSNFGLIWVSSSIFQMMKGSIVVFTAILAVLYRKQKLFGFEITGVIILIISFVAIGGSTFLPSYQNDLENGLSSDSWSSEDEEETTSFWYLIIGIVLIISSQFLQAMQSVVEEQCLHDISAPVTFVVGLEGIYGLIICSCLMPIMGMSWIPDDLYEDTKDTFIMIGNNPTILIIVTLYIVCIFGFNIAGVMVTDYVNAMLRNVMEPLRMITVWIVSVFLYYVVDESIGEKVGLFTILEVFGFILLVLGFLLYTKVIKIPQLFNYPLKDIVPVQDNENVEIMMDEEKNNENNLLINENDENI